MLLKPIERTLQWEPNANIAARRASGQLQVPVIRMDVTNTQAWIRSTVCFVTQPAMEPHPALHIPMVVTNMAWTASTASIADLPAWGLHQARATQINVTNDRNELRPH